MLSDAMSPFSRRLSNHGISYSAHLNSSAFAHMKRPRLQCSIVACGEQCLGVRALFDEFFLFTISNSNCLNLEKKDKSLGNFLPHYFIQVMSNCSRRTLYCLETFFLRECS